MNHDDLIDAVNNAKTEHEHRYAIAYLAGWRKAREGLLGPSGWSGIEADWYVASKVGWDRPMCCGELLDWEAS